MPPVYNSDGRFVSESVLGSPGRANRDIELNRCHPSVQASTGAPVNPERQPLLAYTNQFSEGADLTRR